MLAIDHIVIATKDPAHAAQNFEQNYNVNTIQGGKHEKWGTYNYLAYFSNDSYIEWIGIFDKNIASASDNPLIQQLVSALSTDVEGPIQYALRTTKMDDYMVHLHASNINYIGPIPGSRKKPDGSTLEWRMLFPSVNNNMILPFLIEWGSIKNVPQDERLINSQHLRSVNFGVEEKEIFKHIYMIDTERDSIQLENGLLILEKSNDLHFVLA
ncbi:VOC family protein [Virgibacillus byunsanensis]|uniref:VOC family protein n=1 Tax=Virgibacillus byunsanensis TaxID=570945 RepID=A0ABW3LKI5_9BACI